MSYTDLALDTPEGQQRLADPAEENGLDLDGTPVLTKASDIDNLARDGVVELRTRADDGANGFPWVV